MNTESFLNSKPTTPREALTLTLVLAITAPTDGLSEFEVASAQRDALAHIAAIEG